MNKLFLLILICFSYVNISYSQNIIKDNVDVAPQGSVFVDGVFAVIGDHVIFHSDIDEQIMQYQTQGIDDVNLKDKVIEELFFQKMLLHFADLDSIVVDVNEVESTIEQRIAFFEQQLGSKEKVEEYFQKSIIELVNELKPIVNNQLLVQKMQYKIVQDVDVSPSELEDFYHNLHKDSIPVIETQFQVSQILKKPDPSNSAIEETLSKLEDLRNRILKGADFSTMAILYSEDPGSSRNGGAYYKIKKGFFVKEFEAVAFSLQVDEISEIFETEFGYHIVQLIERRGNEIDVRHILMTPKISNQNMLDAKVFLQSLKDDVIDHTMSFSVAAEQFSSDQNTKFNGGLLINPNTNNSFFSISELETVDGSLLNEIALLSVGDITDPMYIKLPSGKEAYRIIKLVSKQNEHTANLTDDYPYLKNYFFNLKKARNLNQWYKDKVKDIYISSSDMSNYEFYNKLLSNE